MEEGEEESSPSNALVFIPSLQVTIMTFLSIRDPLSDFRPNDAQLKVLRTQTCAHLFDHSPSIIQAVTISNIRNRAPFSCTMRPAAVELLQLLVSVVLC